MEENSGGFNRNTLIAITLIMVFWWGWQSYLAKKYPDYGKPTAATTAQQAAQNPPAAQDVPQGTTTTPTAPAAAAPAANVQAAAMGTEDAPQTYKDEIKEVKVVSRGGKIQEVLLQKYKNRQNTTALLLHTAGGAGLVTLEGLGGAQWNDVFFKLSKPSENVIIATATLEGVTLTKTYTFSADSYAIDASFKLSGSVDKIQKIRVAMEDKVPRQDQSGGFGSGFTNFFKGHVPETVEVYYNYKNEDKRHFLKEGEKLSESFQNTNFAAFNYRYFTNVFVNRGTVIPESSLSVENDVAHLELVYPFVPEVRMTIFSGPTELEALKKLGPGVYKVVDYGMFSWLGYPMLSVLKWFYGIVKNWGVAIILLTLLVRLLTYPFVAQSAKSMRSMAKIQPELARIKEMYKDDKQRLNQEMMIIMRENKVNPVGGCLPMLLQMPVFFALWQVLQNSIELYQAPFGLWIHDLSARDPYFVFPVLMAAAMFVQQKMTPSASMDPAQQRVLQMMPLIFAFIMVNTPSGLTLYLFTSTVIGILQQKYVLQDRSQTKATRPVKA